jgi:hypothetical protein
MLTTDYDIQAYVGCTFRLQVSYLNPDGTPINLTSGYSAKFVIGAAVPLTLTGGAGLTLGNGTIDILITSTQNAGFEPATYPYDLTLTGSDTVLVLKGHYHVTKLLSTIP